MVAGHAPAGTDVLQFLDAAARKSAFEHYWNQLEAASARLDLDTLRTVIRLLPSIQEDISPYERLGALIVEHIPKESEDAEHLYNLAEACLSNSQLGWQLLDYFTSYLEILNTGPRSDLQEISFQGRDIPRDIFVSNAAAYLIFAKCSYWLPPTYKHLITPTWPQIILNLLGLEGLDDACHDTLSSLLALLCHPTGAKLDTQIIHQQLWTRFAELPSDYFSASSSKAFRTWFQWISHAAAQGTDIEGIYDPIYWQRLRAGLLTGFGDQRKYCLGILKQSLVLSRRNINTPLMEMEIARQPEYLKQYDRYSTLFETIVLDRYPNQVQACLPELTNLLGPGSLISSGWTTTLLSTALNPKVQDGIRKQIGSWYIDYAIKEHGPIANHTEFLVEGFLPWGTQGSLFTSSLMSTQTSTVCAHGDALADLISRFFAVVPSDTARRNLLSSILRYILSTGGKMFQPSVLYILQGLIAGLEAQSTRLDTPDVELVLQFSRITGLPEIANDLCVMYCAQLCDLASESVSLVDLPGYDILIARTALLKKYSPSGAPSSLNEPLISELTKSDLPSLQQFFEKLNISQQTTIQGNSFAQACKEVVTILDKGVASSFQSKELYDILDALWEEADRQEFHRRAVINIPPLFFHPSCVRLSIQEHVKAQEEGGDSPLTDLLTKAMQHLQRLSDGRVYLLSTLTISLRRACFADPQILGILPFEELLIRYTENPPSPKKEFLFEVVAAQKLQQHLPHRNYMSYYGKREWHAYAAIIDILNRFPEAQLDVAKSVMRQIIEPWRAQKPPVPIISKWKDVFQLQSLLLLSESCITESEADWYLKSFMHMLILEQWPRYRFLLEWTIVRIYYRFPGKAPRILTDLGNANLDTASPVQIASYIKLAVLSAPFLNSEDFAHRLMTLLTPLSASQKVHVRHEAHWSIPITFDLADKMKWETVTNNPAFQALNAHVRSLDKFNAPPSTIRTLKLDAVADHNLAHIFQGTYLSLETPEQQRVSMQDFDSLYSGDAAIGLQIPSSRLELGVVKHVETSAPLRRTFQDEPYAATAATDSTSQYFQTKSGFDVSSLVPHQGPPSAANRRPASVILIASLIDNPTNLGGLSRISESFGLEALYIDDLKKMGHKDFKATSVTSEKHFPIHELKVHAVSDFLITARRRGYEVVGIEQTDRSGMLGEESGGKGIGTLPKKCVLVLGAEKSGIPKEVLSVLDRCVEIKTVGVTRSLNVQTAGGIAVFEWWREWGNRP
ncbi:hypothetical protein BS50DRAFT_495070 [Corynespora cassiicola Philippines]|uniref:tRNA/rRNA methyltransferase SpoU type domain-containing protein n=1 Tax=Corynespora cassiicola Philippines TaxID=1448308 RepID=A0A2T2NKM3_CORCC|nr:hypothetical protein BS50DRAFT_495070 [Corynespora cassiicola Philippines]